METHTATGKTGLTGSLADRCAKFWRRRSPINELRSFEPEELAQDAGLTKAATWPRYCPNQNMLAALTQMKCH